MFKTIEKIRQKHRIYKENLKDLQKMSIPDLYRCRSHARFRLSPEEYSQLCRQINKVLCQKKKANRHAKKGVNFEIMCREKQSL